MLAEVAGIDPEAWQAFLWTTRNWVCLVGGVLALAGVLGSDRAARVCGRLWRAVWRRPALRPERCDTLPARPPAPARRRDAA